ncbi:protein IMPAIRED IN BABA-INDUCED STERILITY 1-like isoform X1 [Actinidia eriantha]|uniref:protein IMPAIRED IN BABA-INDUCED STERILITY 1-like isoform X1 n=1 Tax=Actinidia eriantha TaxID=165200 RepID=UPI0025856E6C|nr:protein IMPAIRED IN BABA-INDUCED STERILITY 1-like isoform X1 [Actinidia eriantha]
MGCISSKQARSPPPDFDSTTITVRHNGPASAHLDFFSLKRGGFGELEKIKEEPDKENEEDSVCSRNREQKKSRSTKKGSSEKKAVFSLRFGRYTEAEQIAAGWPPWLSAVAGEAVEGWLPLRADLFEKLDKVGQGTYSSVYRARDIETGRIVALKKVRFDTFQPESVRFMAREITILSMFDHPNIMKLEGLITNRLSCSIYLVFEYMEHDLSGLLSCHDIKFSDSQIKCYMRQLLAGLEHCHSRGVMHRDIKASNILVNNEGILKIADFGLANYINVRHRQALTSRVVTLWYRPPELLLGSTNYGAFVDMWSVGCVFAELFIGKPILKGRTEVEQLHKIFRLCGSPPDEYWKKSNLPLATMFKPQHPYVSSLRERCKEFPKSAINLLETFLSIEPHKRGTASSALASEYFTTKPFACDPSSLPRYPPSKEIDAKIREEQRRKASARTRASGTSRSLRRSCKPSQESSSISKVEVESTTQFARRNNGGHANVLKAKGASESRESLRSSYDTVSEASQATEISQVDSIQSVPAVSASTDFAWAKKGRGNGVSTRLRNQASSRGQNFNALDPSSLLHSRLTSDSEEQENEEFSSKIRINTQGSESCEAPKHVTWRQQSQSYWADLFNASYYHSQELLVDHNEQMKRVPFSGPLLSQLRRLAEGQENHTRKTVHNRSRIYRG